MRIGKTHPLIIHAHHALSPWQRWSSWLLTLACWLMWGALWWPVVGYFRDGAGTVQVDWLGLRGYAAVSASVGAVLVLWARVSYWRFSAKEQRRRVRDVSIDELAADLRLPPAALHGGRMAQVLVVHHQPAGGIERIEVGSVGPPPDRLVLAR